MAPDFLRTDGAAVGGGGGGQVTGTAAPDAAFSATLSMAETPVALQRLVLTFATLPATISNTGDFVALKIGDWGDTFANRPILAFGYKIDMAFVKDGGGAITTTDLDFAIGDTAATSGVFSIQHRRYTDKHDVNADTLTPTLVAQDFPNVTSTTVLDYPRVSTTRDIYLNLGGNVSSDALVTLTGTVEIFYMDLGTPA